MSSVGEKRPQSPEAAALVGQPAWIAFGLLVGFLVLGYWNSLKEAAAYWEGPQYSHGWLIPLFTVVLLWMRHQPLVEVPQSQRWYGVGVLAGALLLRIVCAWFGLDIPDMATFVPAVLGVILIIGGWPMFRWAGPAAAFLIFMFPLPWSVEQSLLTPLQTLATRVSTYALQTIGFGAYYEGNRIRIEDIQLGVVDACSGLRMTTIFLALSVAIVLIADRPWWENLVIVLSAVPIALTVNVIRITVTGVLHVVASAELANMVFHDLAGWLMVPMALVLLWIEVSILSNLFVEVEEEMPVVARPGLVRAGVQK
ncbi:MAG TPA: exosortase/archaeosortase family protein [Thermoguttaceae bacterium]|nr:exosortase/archaeosortase family protein [Thermoguttaceae bacterium]